MNRKRRKLLFLTVCLLLLVGLPVWWLNREIQQAPFNTSLIAAIKRSDTPAALDALANGADANARDLGDQQPSLGERLQQLFRRLIGRQEKNSPKPTALQLLFQMKYEHGPKHGTRVPPPENARLMQALLERGADPNVTDEEGRSPLHWACVWNYRAFARLLLEHGADIKMKDNKDYTPIELASGHLELFRIFKEYGAK